jgi:hypothetical protein
LSTDGVLGVHVPLVFEVAGLTIVARERSASALETPSLTIRALSSICRQVGASQTDTSIFNGLESRLAIIADTLWAGGTELHANVANSFGGKFSFSLAAVLGAIVGQISVFIEGHKPGVSTIGACICCFRFLDACLTSLPAILTEGEIGLNLDILGNCARIHASRRSLGVEEVIGCASIAGIGRSCTCGTFGCAIQA